MWKLLFLAASLALPLSAAQAAPAAGPMAQAAATVGQDKGLQTLQIRDRDGWRHDRYDRRRDPRRHGWHRDRYWRPYWGPPYRYYRPYYRPFPPPPPYYWRGW